ncbi:MAG TPA: hypothetical protein VF668_00580 [Pyrinomonadaceae bacterium]|jgi:hypothetical protein
MRPAGAALAPDVGFVACIEGGVLEEQALLLFESLRLYAGRFAGCAAYALSPRAGHAISAGARRRLDELGVHYSDAVINTECTEYGSTNRLAAAAHVEEASDHEFLVILDSDTLFLRQPDEVLLPHGVDVAARPVDLKGMCTEGAGDPLDAYWRDLCHCCGVDYDRIPFVETFVDRRRVKASHNGGLTIARREAGLMRRCADFFFASFRKGLAPRAESRRFRAGVGWVEPDAARLWGSSQAALSMAIWSGAGRVRSLPPTYNYPLHLHERVDPPVARAALTQLVHVHYHWLLEEESSVNPLFYEPGALTPEQADWLRSGAKRVRSAAGAHPLRRLWRRAFGSKTRRR